MKRKKNKAGNLFNDFLYQEIEKSARLRAIILSGLLAFAGISLLLVYLFFAEEYTNIFKSNIAINALMAYALVIIAFELVVHYLVKKKGALFNLRSKFSTYFTTFLEIALLSVLLILVVEHSQEFAILQSPAIFTYFILITLSTLHLDFKISVFSGLLAALEYVGISLYYASFLSGPAHTIPTIQFLGQGIMMVTVGIAAGFVAKLINSKIHASLNSIEEKNQVIDLFGQQISQKIANEILKNPNEFSGRRRNVSIMFLDIRNFTPFVEHKEPEEVVTYLNTLFGFMIEIVQSHNGIINQFLGDGFMATFGAPVALKNSSSNAVEAAQEIIGTVQKKNINGEIPNTRLSIGIHFGNAVTGNIGSEERKQYSITGNVVILASRIEQLNRQFDSQLLISEEVFTQVKPTKKKLFRPIGPVDVKGREKPILIYQFEDKRTRKLF